MTTRIMSSEPSGLGLAVKAALPAVPVIGNLPGVRHKQGDLPTWELLRSDVSTDLSALEQYNEVCGFVRAEALPVTYPHIAAHVMHMKLMTDTDFPFTPLGAVHLRNRITQYRPIGREERYDLRLAASAITPHPKGELVHLTTEAHVGKELVWDETMSVLFRGKKRGDEPEASALAGVKPPTGPVHWNLASDLGRRYGKISGDQNPIHLYPVTARAFGFPRHIAHGMWTKAKALSSLQNRLPDSFTVEVEFKRPILLPSTVVFGTEMKDQDIIFGVQSKRDGVPHMVGRVSPR